MRFDADVGPDLENLHTAACNIGSHMMELFGGIKAPFFMVWQDDKLKVYEAPWQCQEDKARYIHAMRLRLKDYNIDMYSFVTEAWFATVNPRTQPELMNVPPSQRSQRKDVLFISSRSRTGEAFTTQFEVEYDAEGNATLHPGEHLGEVGGFMGNLFERPPPQRHTARP
jgi:hypothetical protein